MIKSGIKRSVNYNFEWDPRKAHDNLQKHGEAFDEAASVFKDHRSLSVFDLNHNESEDRWITLGLSESGRLLVVIHTYREGSEEDVAIRIISSRKATKQETKKYGG
ncbi:MAG: BrnT family toxin [Thermodesulfobacteriota bacterium]